MPQRRSIRSGLGRTKASMSAYLGEKEKDTAKKECNICHNLVDKLWKYNSDEEIACEFCLNLYKLGQDILTQDLVFVISEEKIDGGIKIFGKDKDLYMYAVNIEDIDIKQQIVKVVSGKGNKSVISLR